MILFRYTNGAVIPVPPGTAKANDTGILTAEAAAALSGQKADDLRTKWVEAFVNVVPKTDLFGTVEDEPEPAKASVQWKDLTPIQQDELTRVTQYPWLDHDHFQQFMRICHTRRLSPLCKHLHPMLQPTKDGHNRLVMVTTIDAFRLIADRTGLYEGQTHPEWCGADLVWQQGWADVSPPAMARVGVYRAGFREALFQPAPWLTYAPYTEERGVPILDKFWAKAAPMQLLKCAEALAFRKAFPEELNGLYTTDEMKQAETGPKPPRPEDQRRPAADAAAEGAAPAGARQQREDPEVEEEEFADLLRQHGGRPEATLANFRGIYSKLWRFDKPAFHRRVAAEIRDRLKKRRETEAA